MSRPAQSDTWIRNKYPELNYKSIHPADLSGIAQVALAHLGHKESFLELYEQSFHKTNSCGISLSRKSLSSMDTSS